MWRTAMFRRTACNIAFLFCSVSICSDDASAQILKSRAEMAGATKVIGLSRAREEKFDEIRVTFEVSLGEGFHTYWEPLFSETVNPVTLDCLWAGSNQFKITLRENERVIRTIVADGSQIDTGDGRTWDAKFLHDPPEFPYKKLGDEFHKLMWPYSEVLLSHLFPATENVLITTTWLQFNHPWLIKDDGLSTDLIVMESRRLDGEMFFEMAVDPKRGYMPTLFATGEGQRDYDSTHRYSDPFIVREGIWFPRKYEAALLYTGEKHSLLISQIVEAELLSAGSIDPREFQIVKGESKYIRWKENEFLAGIAWIVDDAFGYGFDSGYIILYLVVGSFALLLLALFLKFTKRFVKRRSI